MAIIAATEALMNLVKEIESDLDKIEIGNVPERDNPIRILNHLERSLRSSFENDANQKGIEISQDRLDILKEIARIKEKNSIDQHISEE